MNKWICGGVWLLCSPLWALDINHASEAELDGLRGVGPAFTRRILSQRSLRPFTDWDDLMRRVAGMGRVTAQRLSEQGLTVNLQVYTTEKNTTQLTP